MPDPTETVIGEVQDSVRVLPEEPTILSMTKAVARDFKARMLLETLEHKEADHAPKAQTTEYLAEYGRCVPASVAEELDATRAWEPRWKKRLDDYLGRQPSNKRWPVTTGDIIRAAMMDNPSMDRAIDRWNAIVNLDGTTAASIRSDIQTGDADVLRDARKLIGSDALRREFAFRDDVEALNEDEYAETTRTQVAPEPVQLTEWDLTWIDTPAVNFAVKYRERESYRSQAGIAKRRTPRLRNFGRNERFPPANNPLHLSLSAPWTRPAPHLLAANRLIVAYGKSIANGGVTCPAVSRIADVKQLLNDIDRDDIATQRLAARELARLSWNLAHSDDDRCEDAVPDVRDLSDERMTSRSGEL